MRAPRVTRIAFIVGIAAALAGCQAVERVRHDMAQDWRKFERDVLNEKAGASAVASRAPRKTTGVAPQTPPDPPRARPPLSPSGPANADDPAIAALRAEAETGDADAAYRLGLRYDRGDSVARDPGEALRWYRRAGERGHALGALNAGVLYDAGEGGLGESARRDPAAAALWYGKAAEAGNGRAAYNLGQLYETGDGVPRDPRQAARWYEAARRAGIDAAAPKLAALTPPPEPAAEATSASLREAAAPAKAAKAPDSLRLALSRDYAVGASAPDDALLAEAIRAAAEAGDREAACNLGMRYVNGRGVTRDWREGARWLRRAAAADHAPAQTNLAMLLADDGNPDADPNEALMWASKAANAGYGPARAQLGMMYAAGRGVARDSRMADFWLASAQRDMRQPPGICRAPSAAEAFSAR
ncbi:MAG: tetratricopeptide repeat protein [Alphaproteobacteria bacterium]